MYDVSLNGWYCDMSCVDFIHVWWFYKRVRVYWTNITDLLSVTCNMITDGSLELFLLNYVQLYPYKLFVILWYMITTACLVFQGTGNWKIILQLWGHLTKRYLSFVKTTMLQRGKCVYQFATGRVGTVYKFMCNIYCCFPLVYLFYLNFEC